MAEALKLHRACEKSSQAIPWLIPRPEQERPLGSGQWTANGLTHLGMTDALGATGTGLKHGARFGERRASGLISSQRPLANLTLKLTPRDIRGSKRVQSWDRSCLDTLGAKGQRSTQLTASWNGPSESNSCGEKAAGWPRPSLRKVRARQERQV